MNFNFVSNRNKSFAKNDKKVDHVFTAIISLYSKSFVKT